MINKVNNTDTSNECRSDEWLNVESVATELSLKPVTVKRYAREGLLNGKQTNNEWHFLATDIEKFKEIQSKL